MTEHSPYLEAYQLVLQFLANGNEKEAKEWFEMKNPFFRNQTPLSYFTSGKSEKALEIIKELCEESAA